MKTNFNIPKTTSTEEKTVPSSNESRDITEEEFEEMISRFGAAGSYMVFRSNKKDDELGLEQL